MINKQRKEEKMNKQQKQAQEDLINWLKHPNELGQEPRKIEFCSSFTKDEMQYYIFKFKKNTLGKWFLGVSGGYTQDDAQSCGHTFSTFEEYEEASALAQAINMVDQIKQYWKEQAQEIQENPEKKNSPFAGFVLLATPTWDKQKLLSDLQEDWDITIDEADETSDSIIVTINEVMCVMSLMKAPIPNNEAQHNAKNNYMWKEAVTIANQHQAHIMVVLLNQNNDSIETAKILTKIIASCCKQNNATGVYTSGTVFEPQFYIDFANVMKRGELPIFNWIWFGLYQGEKGICAYTYGMTMFQKEEMEIVDANAQASDVRDFLANIVSYVLAEDITLNDGETIGFSENDYHKILFSEGISLPTKTLKISYEKTK